MIERSFETEGPLRLDLRLPAGRIEVVAEATATATTELRLEGPDDLAERATVELRGDELRVHVRDRKGFFIGFESEEYELHVRCPAGSSLNARTRSADLEARGRLAQVRCETASGDARLEQVETAALTSASGDIAVGVAAGAVTVGTASGEVEIGRAASVVANVVSGDVLIRDVEGPVTVTSVSGAVSLDAVTSGSVSVQAVSGDLRVGVRRGSLVYVDASTLSGETSSDLDLEDAPAAPGGGGPRVELQLKTVSGDIAVVRAAAAAAPGAAPEGARDPL
jgi:DUF4097 and DUF4098 domain-containing protein YvlB